MMRDHKPISIADQVFEKLERDILSGKYPQARFERAAPSGELGVSRTLIREAIRRLEQARILEDSTRSGGQWHLLAGYADIYEIRLQLRLAAVSRRQHH